MPRYKRRCGFKLIETYKQFTRKISIIIMTEWASSRQIMFSQLQFGRCCRCQVHQAASIFQNNGSFWSQELNVFYLIPSKQKVCVYLYWSSLLFIRDERVKRKKFWTQFTLNYGPKLFENSTQWSWPSKVQQCRATNWKFKILTVLKKHFWKETVLKKHTHKTWQAGIIVIASRSSHFFLSDFIRLSAVLFGYKVENVIDGVRVAWLTGIST